MNPIGSDSSRLAEYPAILTLLGKSLHYGYKVLNRNENSTARRGKQALFAELPFLTSLIDLAVKLIHPKKIILFGSRARGDHGRTSDVDIAFFFRKDPYQWARFVAEAEEDLPTLLELNLVDVHSASPAILESIKKEGICVYERKKPL